MLRIDAPPETVWRHVVAFSELPAPEDWLFRIGIAYPEWDWRSEQYLDKHVVVREREARLGDPAWVEQALSSDATRIEAATRIRQARTTFSYHRYRQLLAELATDVNGR